MRFLVDECCPAAIVEMLRSGGHDVRYAAETDRRSTDEQILAIANAENRIVVTEDFDFGDLLIRDRQPAPGAIVLFLPRMTPAERASRLANVLAAEDFSSAAAFTIIEARRVR
jgi:predicted nuclease of predicted toxin-antitoxin system